MAPSQRILEFVETTIISIPSNYGFILQQLQNIAFVQGTLPLEIEEQSWIDWYLRGQTPFLQSAY